MQDRIGSEFERLMAQDPNGMLRPEAVIEAAQNPAHPFHDWFDWDDAEAARKWRLEQAGLLIRSFKINIPDLNIKVRALTSLETDRAGGGGYRWLAQAIANPDMRKEMLATALKDLRAIESKYAHLEELAQVWEATHTIEHQVMVEHTN